MFRISADSRNKPNVNMNPHLTFEIVFDDVEVFQHEPLIPSLLKLINFTESLIDHFFEALPELESVPTNGC